MRLWQWGAAACGALVIVWAGALRADLLRCKGPDGRTIYTDDKSRCPGVDPFEPRGKLQRADEPPSAGAASPAPAEERVERAQSRQRAAEAEQGEARRWRQKREEAEQQLEQLSERKLQLGEFVSWCNRGGSVVTRDVAGIKQEVPCPVVREEYEGIDVEQEKLRSYLRTGLAEECRKAGCLPGWIR